MCQKEGGVTIIKSTSKASAHEAQPMPLHFARVLLQSRGGFAAALLCEPRAAGAAWQQRNHRQRHSTEMSGIT